MEEQGPWEVEQKFCVDDIERLQQSLAERGFSHVRLEQHRDTYFRHPCRDFRSTDEAFRVRCVDEQAVVTYKGPRADSDIKVRTEIELAIQHTDFSQWLSMLDRLGFVALPDVKKTRDIYTRAHSQVPTGDLLHAAPIVVTIDRVNQLGDFAEVELVVHVRGELDTAQRAVADLARQLGLDRVQPLSYLAQLLKKKGIET